MKRLLKIQDKVREILKTCPAARNNDMLLYYKLAEEIDRKYQQDAIDRPFGHVVLSLEDYHLPSFGSVSRARRRVQTLYPKLRANDTVEGFRAEEEQKYREYARR